MANNTSDDELTNLLEELEDAMYSQWGDDPKQNDAATIRAGNTKDRLKEFIKQREEQVAREARIDELSQHFLDTDELCMVDSVTKIPVTVKRRKQQLYEELEDGKA